jgi:hypothetical protein
LIPVIQSFCLCTEEDDEEEEDLSGKMFMPEGSDIILTLAQKKYEQDLMRLPPSNRVGEKNGINGKLP